MTRCMRRGKRLFYPRRKTTLYYVKFYPPGRAAVYKIGITTKTVEQRFAADKIPYEVLYTKLYSGGREAYEEEQRIIFE